MNAGARTSRLIGPCLTYQMLIKDNIAVIDQEEL